MGPQARSRRGAYPLGYRQAGAAGGDGPREAEAVRQHDERDSLAVLPWYPRDWRASEARAILSPLQRGIYRELLDSAWLSEDCSLPGEDRVLAALAGVDGRTWEREKALVLERFEAREDGRLQHRRLTFEHAKSVTLRERRRHGATATNAARANAERHAERHAERTPPSPSPSPSPVTSTDTPLPPKGERARKATKPRIPPEAEDGAAKLVQCFNAAFGRRVQLLPDIAEAFQARLTDGHSAQHLIAIPLLYAAEGMDAEKRQGLQVGYMLRNGGRGYVRDGVQHQGYSWISILQRADKIGLREQHARIADELGLSDTLRQLGVRWPAEDDL